MSSAQVHTSSLSDPPSNPTSSVGPLSLTLNCIAPCRGLGINRSLMVSKSRPREWEMKEMRVSLTLRAALTTPLCGPCVMAGQDNLSMYEKYDLHIIDSQGFKDDRNFFKPPPDKVTLFAVGCLCYAYVISWHENVLSRARKEGEILYDWETSNRAARSQGFEDVALKKVAILGAPGSGKSGVFSRLCGGGFPEAVNMVQGTEGEGESSLEVGGRFRDKNVNVGIKMVKMEGEGGEGALEFWDVPPDCQASNTEVTSDLALQGASLVVIIFDVRHKSSFLNLMNAVEEIKVRAHENDTPQPPFTILGNFCDTLQTEDRGFRFKTEVDAFCRKIGGGEVKLVSARTGEGIVDAFKEIWTRTSGDEGTKPVNTEGMERG